MAVKTIALLGTYPPRRCGIAAFTEDLSEALLTEISGLQVSVIAMNDGAIYSYDGRVAATIDEADLASYETAADVLNESSIDLLCVQHEFGIFGGPDGSFLLTLLRRVRVPIVTTLHTVLENLTPGQAQVLEELAALSTRLVVMSQRAMAFLVAQGVPRSKISFIHHGVPKVEADQETEKVRLGLGQQTVILTFGLLSPNKGIETVIRALPTLVRGNPDVLYLVLGATHPHVISHQGETYREHLTALSVELGVERYVRFDNTYSDSDGITRALAAADICLLPYLNREQITSGTLAYAVGNGKVVVSTPFWHAEELLADGRGVLVPFDDPGTMGEVLRALCLDADARTRIETRALAYGTQMRWPNVARSYSNVFGSALRQHSAPAASMRVPALALDHVAAFTDSTGMLQHATVAVPNLHEGYTTDDNARALHLASMCGFSPQASMIARRTLAFLAYALNPATRRFRNFMAYDRSWLDEDGGENAQARSVRALVAASHALPGSVGDTARELLKRSWMVLDGFTSPRAQAIGLVALASHAEKTPLDPGLRGLADQYAANLLIRRAEYGTSYWPWFETALSYSNAKLPHGLIAYGRAFGRNDALDVGLKALCWLETQQTAPNGAFLPIGCERLYGVGEARPMWDGQPVEVYATVAATLEAHRATGDSAWLASARRALEWLLGRNALDISLYDPDTAGCRDGLHRDRANANQGAESTLALWLSVVEYSQAVQLTVTPRIRGA